MTAPKATPNPNLHVIPHKGRWGVLNSGAKRASCTFDTQKEAINSAREKAKMRDTKLYVHGRDERIRERHSYDPQRRYEIKRRKRCASERGWTREDLYERGR